MSSRRAVKRIKIELDTINSSAARPQSRLGLELAGSMVRSQNSRNIAVSKLQPISVSLRLILPQGKVDTKFEGLPSIVHRRAMFEAISTSENHGRISASSSNDSMFTEGWSKTIEDLVADAERHLMHAEAKHDHLLGQIQELQNAPPTVSTSTLRFVYFH